ncbi:MAG: isochorismatase family protein, partial [bacterium]
LNKDFDVYLLADAVSSRTLENKHIALEAMQKYGVNITSLEMAVFEMLGVAKGDEFKQVIKIIK